MVSEAPSDGAAFHLHVWGPVAQNVPQVTEPDWLRQVKVDSVPRPRIGR